MAKNEGSLRTLINSVKGASNATRSKFMTPEARKRFEARVIAARKKQAKRKAPERAVRDAVKSRDANEALDLRSSLDPNVATRRRLKKAGG